MRDPNVKPHKCVRCGIDTEGFSCRDCLDSCDRFMVYAWSREAKAAYRKRREWEERIA